MMFASARAANFGRVGIVSGAFALVCLGLPWAGPAAAAGDGTRGGARTRIPDACGYSEWKGEKRRDTAAARCGCAAGKMVKSMSDEEFAAYVKAGKLTSVHKEKWDAAMDACD